MGRHNESNTCLNYVKNAENSLGVAGVLPLAQFKID